MMTADPDPKMWDPPFSSQSRASQHIKCTGKNIADCVESLLGAFFMSNNLRKTLELISDINLIPLRKAHLLEDIPDKDLTFELGDDLYSYNFTIEDRVIDIYEKYFALHSNIDISDIDRIRAIIDPTTPVPILGEAYIEFLN